MLSLDELEKYFPENVRSYSENILREYLQYKILEIAFDSKVSQNLCFIGGTALRIVHNTGRFSEDLDFDNFNLSEEQFYSIKEILNKKLEQEGFYVEINSYTLLKNTYHFEIKFLDLLYENKISGHKNAKLLIKVDTQSQCFDYVPEKKVLKRFDVLTQINVAPIDVLLSMKLNAIFGRKRVQGRDFYDVAFLFTHTKPSYKFLEKKLNISNPKELKSRLLAKCEELDFNKLEQDVEPLIFDQKELKKIKLFKELISEVL